MSSKTYEPTPARRVAFLGLGVMVTRWPATWRAPAMP